MNASSQSRQTFLLCALAFLVMQANGAKADEFYAGKTLTMSTHTGPGGGYDTLLRLVARHIGRHLPGRPNIIVVNMPGAGGLTAFNHVARIAPHDGTFISLIGQGLLVFEPTGQPGMQASLASLRWIGNVSQSPNVTAVWSTAHAKTIADARVNQIVIGSTGAGSPDAQIPSVYNALLGTRFKLVYGYEGGGALNLAMERGEIEGRGTNTWPSYKATLPNAVRDKKLIPLIQIGLKKDPDLADVPLFLDLVKGDPVKEPVARFLSLTTAISRPFAAPPGVSDERLAQLRQAFDETMRDAEFLSDAERQNIDVDAMSGVAVKDSIRQILATPSDVIARTQLALQGKSQ